MSKPTLKQLYSRAPKVIEDLLALVDLYKDEDFPDTCGACGTPAGNCDTDCMDAAHMSRHNGNIHRAKEWLKAIDARKKVGHS